MNCLLENMSKHNPRIDNLLWKAILEETFGHFLSFMFDDAVSIFDMQQPYEYLDKEFETLFPPEPNGKGVRYVDKLVKVHLQGGGTQFILCHLEIQSSKGTGDLAQRMFEYYYKIKSKYQVPVTAIAILADGNKSYRPSLYMEDFMGTRLTYEFNSYKILDQEEDSLRTNPNPFAVVVLTALLAILRSGADDDELMGIKHDLYGEMLSREMDKSTRRGIYNFLAHYVRFENSDNFHNFEEELKKQQGRNFVMGTEDYLLDKAKKEGLVAGKKEGKLEEALKIAREMKKDKMSVGQIAKFTKLSIEEIEKL